LTFVANTKYLSALARTRASAVLLRDDVPAGPLAVLRTADPYLAFARAVGLFAPCLQAAPGVHAMAAVAAGVQLGDRVSIGAFVSVGEGTSIGDGTVIFPNVTIGPGVRIGAGASALQRVDPRTRDDRGARRA
jgi:UDP-3-O-[3-hydroxymyristoyl] glucosamine N-acyltransferase